MFRILGVRRFRTAATADTMNFYHFSKFDPDQQGKSPFEKLLDLFLQLLTYTNGDFNGGMQWMNELDKEYKLTDDQYGMCDFIDDLKDKGYIDDQNQTGEIKITPKTEQGIRKRSLEEIFGKLKKTKQGNHNTYRPGNGDEINPETRPFQFGDTMEQIDFTSSFAMRRSIMVSIVSTCRKMIWRSVKQISNRKHQQC